jgi:hypothetical protein
VQRAPPLSHRWRLPAAAPPSSWIRINDNRHQYASTRNNTTGDLRVHGRIYFGTNGRRVIYGDLA